MIPRLTTFSCLLLVVLTCCTLLRPDVLWSQTSAARILEVQVEGNRTSDASLIITMSGLTVGKEITTEDVQDAIRQLYSLGIFKDIRILDRGQTPEGIKITIQVEEYPVLDRYRIEGNEKIDTDEIMETLHLAQGQVITPQKILKGEKAIRSLYREKGFLLAKVETEIAESDTSEKTQVTYTINEGKKVKVRRIEIEGNLTFDDGKIRKQMKTKKKGFLRGGTFKENQFEEDLTRIADFYKREGYRDAEVLDHSVSHDESLDGMIISINLSEGQRYRFGSVQWNGNELYTNEELEQFIRFKEGEIYNQEKFDQSEQDLHTAYTEKGYLYVQIIPKETVREDVIDIEFLINEGLPAKIHRIEIAGNTKTRDYVIRRELVVKPNDLFRSSALQRSIREVYQLNFFKDVQIEPEPLENGDIDLTFKVEEKPTGQANFAAGYSARDKMVGSIGFSIPNFRGMGQRLDFSWDFGQIRKTIRFGFSEPWLFGSRTSMGIDVYRSSRDWTSYYDERRTGGALKIGRRLRWPDDYFRLYGTYRWEQVEYRNIDDNYSDPAGLRNIDWPMTTSSIGFTVIRDSRDLPEFATRGSVNSYYIQLAGGLLGGNYNYHKHILNNYWYFPMYQKLAFMFKTQSGIVRTFGTSKSVPFSERFFPGGTSFDGMIRGYDDRSVGPRSQGTEIGGRTMLIFTLEGQFPIVEQQVYGILFADAGNAWSSISQTDPFELQRSAGFGIRIVAPMIGLIGIDLAYRLDNLFEQKKGEWQPHFQMGTAF
jgi:outer membrane protein insertion porin family